MSTFIVGGGLCLGVGFVLWVMVSIMTAVANPPSEERSIVWWVGIYGSFALMTAGPILFWLVLPAWTLGGRLRQRMRRNRVAADRN